MDKEIVATSVEITLKLPAVNSDYCNSTFFIQQKN